MSKSVAEKHGIAYTLPKAKTGVVKLQDEAFKLQISARNATQIALVGTLYHLWKHGDISLMQRMVDEMSEGANKFGMVAWIKKYAGLSIVEQTEINEETGKEVKREYFKNLMKEGQMAEHIKSLFQDAKETMFWSFAPPPAVKPFCVSDAIRADIDKADRLQKKVESGKIAPEDRDKFKLELDEALIRQLAKRIGLEIVGDTGEDKTPQNTEDKPAPIET